MNNEQNSKSQTREAGRRRYGEMGSLKTVIYVRPGNAVFIDKHCCSSVLMLRPHRLSLELVGAVFPDFYALLTASLEGGPLI